MPRVHHVSKAHKDKPEHGIYKGNPYYWWKPRRGMMQFSTTYPRRSQLTGSAFLGTIYDLEDDIPSTLNCTTLDDLKGIGDAPRDASGQVQELGDEEEGKIDNMPEPLQESPTAELLRSRKEECDRISQELESAADEIESILDDADESDFDDMKYGVQDQIDGVDWSTS